ncbi:MAG: hypothetical protein LBK60_00455 [Verrucomicrobiales bacterium]|nr:hypothetical protein [Verrucomicrobiales bacterium]
MTNVKAQLATVSGEKTTLAGQLKDEQTAHTKTKGELATVSGERDTLKAKVSDLEAKAQAADVKAAEIVASIGQPAPAPAQPGAPVAQQTKREEYAAISDPMAKAEFWAKHKGEILSGK